MQQRRVMAASTMTNPENNNLSRFASSDANGLKVSPQHTLIISVLFIVVVFILHIIGKIVGFATSSSPAAAAAAP